MAISSAFAYYGLQANAEMTGQGVNGTVSIGPGQTNVPLTAATEALSFVVEVDGAGTVDVDMDTGVATPSGAGTAQVETATAAGTITGSGNATVTVTGDDIEGSPLAVSVAVTATDTAATWAGKVRTALGLQSAITDVYTVGGASTSITLTRTAARYNDSTLNIALANGTCTGITEAASSANTTAGVNPARCYRLTGTTLAGDDFEGKTVPTIGGWHGVLIRVDEETNSAGYLVSETDGVAAQSIKLRKNGGALLWGTTVEVPGFETSLTASFSTTGGYKKALVVLVGT